MKPRLATPWKVVYFYLLRMKHTEKNMTTVMPHSEMTRKAVAWISEIQANGEGDSLVALIENAAVRFNLGPKDVECLHHFFKDKQD